MGAGDSRPLETVEPLQAQLARLEAKITGLEAGHRALHSYADTQALLRVSGDAGGATVRTADDVRVLVGPVVGKVTASSAVILLEVSAEAELECHVTAADALCPEGRPFLRLKRRFPARRPATFVLQGLRPCERYNVFIGGVCRADAAARTARFSTFDTFGPGAAFLAVSWDRPEAQLAGAASAFDAVAARLRDAHKRPIDVTLHVGGQVWLRAPFERAWFLLRHSFHPWEPDPRDPVGEELAAEQRAEEAFRDVYRAQWNRPGLREALAAGSHLMLWSDRDVYPNYTQDPRLLRNDRLARVLARAARTVFLEYQRQLWDADAPALSRSIAVHVRARLESAALVARAGDREAEKAEAEAALARLEELGSAEGAAQYRSQIKALEREAQVLKRMERVALSEPPDHAKNTFAHLVGDTGFLCVDMRGHRLEVDGSVSPDKPLLSDEQWQVLEGFVADNAALLRRLVLVSELPLVDDAPETLRQLADGGHEGNEARRSWWGYNHTEQTRLLRFLFDWRAAAEGRDVVLVGAGLGCAARSAATDAATGGEIRQVVAGPVCDEVLQMPLPPAGRVAGGGVRFAHEPVLSCGPGFWEVHCEAPCDAVYSAELDGGVNVLLGPVVGRVTHEAARVMLEVDAAAPVMCSLTDVLTGETVARDVQTTRARRPTLFELGPLMPERHYEVRFAGLSDPARARGSFTTPPRDSGDVSLAFVYGECAPALAEAVEMDRVAAGQLHGRKPDGRLWTAVTDLCARPFGGVAALVHCGGQFNAAGAVEGALIEMRQLWDADKEEELEEAVMDAVRDAYRTQWTLPAVREALARVPNLMVRGHRDELRGAALPAELRPAAAPPAWPRGVDAAEAEALLARCLRHAYDEYQAALGPVDQAWGQSESTGVLAIDVDDMPWAALERFFAAPELRTAILVSETPVAELGCADVALKAAHESHAHLRHRFAGHPEALERLLALVCEWVGDGRSATLVCGGQHVGMDSLLRDSLSGASLRQVVVGPLADRLGGFLGEQEGELSARFRFQHAALHSERNFAVVEAVAGCADVAFVLASASASVLGARRPSAEHLALRRRLWCAPAAVVALHALSADEAAEPDEELRALLDGVGAPLVAAMHAQLHCEGARYDSVAYGARLAEALRGLYDGFPDEHLRRLLPPPCRYLAEHVAHLRQANAGLEPLLAQTPEARAERIRAAAAEFVAACARAAGRSTTVASVPTALVQDNAAAAAPPPAGPKKLGGLFRRARGVAATQDDQAAADAARAEEQARRDAEAAARDAERDEAASLWRDVQVTPTGGRDDRTPLVLVNQRSFADLVYAVLRQGKVLGERLGS